jgi:transposase
MELHHIPSNQYDSFAQPQQSQMKPTEAPALAQVPSQMMEPPKPIRNKKSKDVPLSTQQNLVDLVVNRQQSIKEASQIINIHYSTARKIMSRFRKEGRLVKKRRGGSSPKKLTPFILQKIQELMEESPNLTLKKIKEVLETNYGLTVCQSSISNGLNKLNLSLEKSHKVKDKMELPSKSNTLGAHSNLHSLLNDDSK